MSTLIVYKDNIKTEIPVTSGASLLELLRSGGFSVNAPCGGTGKCGKCLVSLTENGVSKNVFACRTYPKGDCIVTLPGSNDDLLSDDGNTASFVMASEDVRSGYGAAVDLGTTSVAVKLIRLSDGMSMGTLKQENDQRSFGADVITRIDHCTKNNSGLDELSAVIRSQVKRMTDVLCLKNAISYSDVSEIVIAGNTIMQHIFAGLSPVSIASAPFVPLSFFDDDTSYELDGVPVFFVPCAAGYVGGDITAGLLAAGLCDREERSLFIDVGTNGEIVLGGKDRFISCAVACGPAFEGAEITCGMAASEGAICAVEMAEGGLKYDVIGGGEAVGICGSGLLDLISCLLNMGYIDESGCLETSDEGGEVFRLSERVFLTQRDIRQLQLAKAALAAGIKLLLRREKMTVGDVDKLYLAGAFGSHLNMDSAVRIGMLPQELKDRVVFLGNASLAGGEQILLSQASREKMHEIRANCRYTELSSDTEFSDAFVDEMTFPEDILWT